MIAKLRYISLVAVIGSFLGSLLMYYIGIFKVYKAVFGYWGKSGLDSLPVGLDKNMFSHFSEEAIATILVIDSLDSFLIALVLMYLSYGIYDLVINRKVETPSDYLDEITSKKLGHLKKMLSQIILLILFVLFLKVAWVNLINISWNMLVLPASIALLALSLKVTESN
jgi:uncharacterized membrane protein YqhA